MKPKYIILVILFMVSFMAAACQIWFAEAQNSSQAITFWLPTIISIGLVFSWVHLDSVEHRYARSALLNIGIVALAIIFIPVYLFKSRPTGAKTRALGGFAAIFIGNVTASFIGALFAQHVQL